MLCRVADSLFWLSRYIERAENTARLVDVNLQMLLDLRRAGDETVHQYWTPLLVSLGDLAPFRKRYERADSRSVSAFLTLDASNPSSVLSSVTAARENARMIRDQISAEMWEVINRMYLFIREQRLDDVWQSGLSDFCQQVREYAQLFEGLTDATYPREVGYEFIRTGRFLERADKTGRLLDTRHFASLRDSSDAEQASSVPWVALLRATSALEAYHQQYQNDVDPRFVAEMLIRSRSFPRSVRYCVEALEQSLHAISGCPFSHYDNEAERLCGRLLAELKFTSMDEIVERGLHRFLEHVCDTLEAIGLAFSERYMFFPVVDSSANGNASQSQVQSQPPGNK